MKKRWVFFVLMLSVGLLGCARCILIHSEYMSTVAEVTGDLVSEEDIQLFASGENVPFSYKRIGMIKVVARPHTARTVIEAEMRKRASLAGADAVVAIIYDEDELNTQAFCSFLVSTKRNVMASGIAVIKNLAK